MDGRPHKFACKLTPLGIPHVVIHATAVALFGKSFPIGNDRFPLVVISFLSVTSSTHQSKEHTGPKGWVKKTETIGAAHRVPSRGDVVRLLPQLLQAGSWQHPLTLNASGTWQPKCAGVGSGRAGRVCEAELSTT